jgi:hypothetical protein
MAVTAAGMEADLAGTGEVAADSGADRGTAGEDTAAAVGGLGGCRDSNENRCQSRYFIDFVSFFFHSSLTSKCSMCSNLFFFSAAIKTLFYCT